MSKEIILREKNTVDVNEVDALRDCVIVKNANGEVYGIVAIDVDKLYIKYRVGGEDVIRYKNLLGMMWCNTCFTFHVLDD